jgi:hypothetical protein
MMGSFTLMLFYPNILTFMWESTWDGGQWICFWGLCNLPDTIGQKISQIAQTFWAEMKTIFNIYKVLVIIEQNENSQNAKKIQALKFFRVPNFFRQKWKKNQHL